MADNTVNVYIVGHNRTAGAFRSAESGLQGLATRMQNVGRTMTTFVTLPIVAGFALAAREANEAIKVTKQTEAVLKSTGGAANVTAREVSGLADALMRKTAIDDETIQSGENLLLTFKNIRNEAGKGNDIFTRATKVMLDMSVALGQDTKTSAIQLGKALQDPIRGITALRRVGVGFNEQQTEQIRLLVESGDLMGAQKIILKELFSEFGGSAEAAVTPLDRFKVRMQELAEQVGSRVLPMLDNFANVIVALADAFMALPDWAQQFVIGGLAVSAAVGPFLQLASAALRAGPAIMRAGSAIAGAASSMGAWGVAGVAVAGVALGIEQAITSTGLSFEVTAQQIAGATKKQIAAVAAVNYSNGTLADSIRAVAQQSPEMARRFIEAARSAGVAKEDLERYERIVRQTERGNKRLEGSFKGVGDAASGAAGDVNSLINAQLGLEGANLNVESALQRYNEALLEHGPAALETRQAELQYKQSVEAVVQAQKDAGNGVEGQIDALNFLKGTLAPDSPLRAFLDQYIYQLRFGIPGSVTTEVLADVAAAQGVIDDFVSRNWGKRIPITLEIREDLSRIGGALVPA